MSDEAGSGAASGGADAPDNLVDMIEALVEPAAPPPVPLTPQTWGWAALAILAALLILWLVRRAILRQRANAYRRAALAELHGAGTAAEISSILRRAALAAFPRREVAGLHGPDWSAFLDRTSRGGFPDAAGAELRAAPYRDETAAPSPALREAAASWIAGHDADRAADGRARA